MKRLTVEQKRVRRAGTQAAMKRRAESTRCPKCSRKSALVRVRNSLGIIEVVVCRWTDCNYERPGVATRPSSEEKS